MHLLPTLAIAGFALVVMPTAALAEFRFQLSEPDFEIVVPELPQIPMRVHPMAADRPHLRYFGMAGDYAMTIVTPRADPGTTSLDCVRLKASLLRPKALRDAPWVQRELKDGTYLLQYAVPFEGVLILNVHFFRAAPDGRHCLEAQVSTSPNSRDAAEKWFSRFQDSSITPGSPGRRP